ncbi:MAG: BRO family protein [Methylococcaceae bacterium]
MTTLALTFNGVNLSPISHKNQTWLTSVELAKALGYAREDSVSRIYDRNKDEFNDSMTMLRDRQIDGLGESSGLQAKQRIFSLRGCHLIAMFAKTVIAKQFRKWVLDILDKEVGETKSLLSQTPAGLSELLSANLTPLKKIMMLTLASQADENGQVQIGIHDLANICGIAKSTTCESVNGLEKAGFLTITKTYGVTGGSQPNIYTIPERFRFSTGGAIEVKQHDWINQPVESALQPAFSIPNNMVMISAERYREMEQSSLELQFADLKNFVEQSGGLVLMKCEVDRMKGVLKA